MAYFYVCPECGSHLDPGETCDCKREQGAEAGERKFKTGGGEVLGGYFMAAGRALPRYGNRAVRVG